jgi:hypothetical protein
MTPDRYPVLTIDDRLADALELLDAADADLTFNYGGGLPVPPEVVEAERLWARAAELLRSARSHVAALAERERRREQADMGRSEE